jgi:hypothetical protein
MMARYLWLALLPLTLTACPRENDEALTSGEAQQALEESQLSAEAENLSGSTVEISTNFTIGQAVETAAQELRTFIVTQLPCAEVSVSAGTLSVTYGALPGVCTYHGQTYSGTHTITVQRNDAGDVLVHHAWDALANQRVSVTGTADVTWSLAQGSRRVQHELAWTRLSDGRTGTGSGDRTQTALPGGIAEGIEVNGSRTWEGARGTWDLGISGVQMRWVDPVPQAGTYTLGTPAGKSITLAFERQDGDTIRVSVSRGNRSFYFDVTSAGAIEQAG